jgi:hypothetical protein
VTESYPGSCHCGAIGYTYHTAAAPSGWSVRACQCTFCVAHDALSTSDPRGRIEFHADFPEYLQRYRFGLGTADFLLCKKCGVYIGALIETERGRYGIVNVHALAKRPDNLAPVAPISYDQEDTGARVQRREERWTPVVRSPCGG